MIDKLIEKYKEQMNENYDEDNKYADLSKAFAYKEIIKDLEELKKIVREELYNNDFTIAEYKGICERLGVDKE